MLTKMIDSLTSRSNFVFSLLFLFSFLSFFLCFLNACYRGSLSVWLQITSDYRHDECYSVFVFCRAVIKAFYTSGHLIDVLTLFGELDENLLATRKYAKWKVHIQYLVTASCRILVKCASSINNNNRSECVA